VAGKWDLVRINKMSEKPAYRWHVVVTYRSDNDPLDLEHTLEELAELHDLAERGPAVQLITITRINHVTATDLTVEQAEKLLAGRRRRNQLTLSADSIALPEPNSLMSAVIIL
jgi:hypothetical protein